MLSNTGKELLSNIGKELLSNIGVLVLLYIQGCYSLLHAEDKKGDQKVSYAVSEDSKR